MFVSPRYLGRLTRVFFLICAILAQAGLPHPSDRHKLSQCESQDAHAVLQSALEQMDPGETYYLKAAESLCAESGLIIPSGVTLDLNGSNLVVHLTQPSTAAVRLLSGSGIQHGTITVRSHGHRATQTGAHSVVLVGALYGENVDASQISRFAGVSDWTIKDLVVSTDKQGAAAIQLMGGVHDGLIEQVTVLPSTGQAGGIMMDWGTVGSIASDDVIGSDRQFRKGLAWTTHPHRITVRDVEIGSREGASGQFDFGVRLSGVHDISISGVVVYYPAISGIAHTAGDLGYEFALNPDRSRAHRAIAFRDIRVVRAGLYGVQSDSFADNIARACELGYRSRLPAVAAVDLRIHRLSASGESREENIGVRFNHQQGGRLSDLVLSDFAVGLMIDEAAADLSIENLAIDRSRVLAVQIGHGRQPPERIAIEDLTVSGAEQISRTIVVDTSEDVGISHLTGGIVKRGPKARNFVLN